MATNANWTIIFDDKSILKNYDEGSGIGGALGYKIDDDAFWNDAKFSNIWAIQYGTSVSSDEVEYRDTTPHTSYADANLGDINQFTNKWDAKHLIYLQETWDNDNYDENGNLITETESEKIARIGARPTSYTSS
jgi:hypothetical protein